VKLPSVRDRGQPGIADPASARGCLRTIGGWGWTSRSLGAISLNGVAIAAGALAGGMLPGVVTEGLANEAGSAGSGERHPPRLTVLRASHPGSFELAHKLRDGDMALQAPGLAETYDS